MKEENTVFIEQMLYKLRKRENYTYLDLVEKLQDTKIKEQVVKKWEKGLAYPELDTIYKLSEIYQVPSSDFLKAKEESLKKGINSIHKRVIQWICISFHVTLRMAEGIIVLFYGLALFFSFLFFVTMCQRVG